MSQRVTKQNRLAADLEAELTTETPVSAVGAAAVEIPRPAFLGSIQDLFSQPLVRISAALVFFAVAWQVFVLGFYLDDWPFIVRTARAGAGFSIDRWHAARQQSLPRPGLTPLWYVLSSVLGRETILWHSALLLVNIALAYLLFEIGRALTSDFETRRSGRIIYFTVLFWFIAPWNATFHFWPTDVPVLLILDLFTLCMLLTIRGWLTGRFALIFTLIGYLWACIGYEAVYFQWVPLGALGLVLVWVRRLTFKNFVRGLTPFVIAQGTALIWMSISLRVNHGTQNEIVHNWPAVFIFNVRRLPGQLIRSTAETGWIAGAAVLAWGAAATYVYIRSLFTPGERSATWLSIGKVSACVFGAILSILAFSLGGRPIMGVGVDARSLLGASIWSIVAAGLVNTFCWPRAGRHVLNILRTAMVVSFVALTIGHLQRAFDWAEAWRQQNSILQQAPVTAMKEMEPGAAVLMVNPAEIDGAPILAAPWDVNNAMTLTYPILEAHQFMVYNPWLGPLEWRNGTLAYNGLTLSKGRPVYVWVPGAHDFYKAAAPFTISQDVTIHPLK